MSVNHSLGNFVEQLADHQEGFANLFDRMGYLVLLPLLEFPYAEVRDRLLSLLVAKGVAKHQAMTISLRDLIAFAIEHDSSYWAGLAFRWIEAGFPLDQELVVAIDRRIGTSHDWPQNLRHQAFRLARLWQRQQE